MQPPSQCSLKTTLLHCHLLKIYPAEKNFSSMMDKYISSFWLEKISQQKSNQNRKIQMCPLWRVYKSSIWTYNFFLQYISTRKSLLWKDFPVPVNGLPVFPVIMLVVVRVIRVLFTVLGLQKNFSKYMLTRSIFFSFFTIISCNQSTSL